MLPVITRNKNLSSVQISYLMSHFLSFWKALLKSGKHLSITSDPSWVQSDPALTVEVICGNELVDARFLPLSLLLYLSAFHIDK